MGVNFEGIKKWKWKMEREMESRSGNFR